jgi:hypothetical protein
MADGGQIGAGLAVGIGGGIIQGLMMRKQRQHAEEQKQLAGELSVLTLALKQAQDTGNTQAAGMIFDHLGRIESAKDKDTKQIISQFQPLMKALIGGGASEFTPDAGAVKRDIAATAQRAQGDPNAPARKSLPEDDRPPLFQSEDQQQERALSSKAKLEHGREAKIQALVDRGFSREKAEAVMQQAQTTEQKRPPQEGTLGSFILEKIADEEAVVGHRLSANERLKVTSSARKEWGELGRQGKEALNSLPPTLKERVSEILGAQGIMNPTEDQIKSALPEASKALQAEAKEKAKAVEVRVNAAAAAAGVSGGTGMTTFDASRPDPATANTVDPRIGATPNSLWQDAIDFTFTGNVKGLPMMASKGVQGNYRMAIRSKSAAMATLSGHTTTELRQEWNKNQKILGTMAPRYGQLKASATTAKENIELVNQQSDKVARSGSKMVNRFQQWTRREVLTGDPELAQFEEYLYTAAREYARVTTGAAASIGHLPVSAAEKADQLINAAQSPAVLSKVLEGMQRDMDNVTRPYAAEIANASQTVADFFKAVYGEEEPAAAHSAGGQRGAGNNTALAPGTRGTVQGQSAVWDGTGWLPAAEWDKTHKGK